jgi:hypothetical protein
MLLITRTIKMVDYMTLRWAQEFDVGSLPSEVENIGVRDHQGHRVRPSGEGRSDHPVQWHYIGWIRGYAAPKLVTGKRILLSTGACSCARDCVVPVFFAPWELFALSTHCFTVRFLRNAKLNTPYRNLGY